MKIIKFFKNNILLLVLSFFVLLNIAVNARINLFRYNNFDFGKFDLGNMTQMLWYTLHGKLLYLTDYFGSNVPRWSMSHVDPILLVFVPLFALYQHPLTLVFSQFILIILGAILIYKISMLELKSKFPSVLISIAYLFYPAIGFINAQTGFHGVSAAIPFFLTAFYIFELMYKERNFSKSRLIWFWIMLVITMSGKEQIPLYVFMYALFIILFRSTFVGEFKLNKEFFSQFVKLQPVKTAIQMAVVSLIWFVLAFFVIIPQNAHYRVESYENFSKSLELDFNAARDVSLDNYFLSRYEAFGDSYVEIAINMLLSPREVVKVFFGGDKLENLQKTFEPLAYLPLAHPVTLLIAAPDFFINYLTTADGIGTSEIENHRVSMIIPVLFISTIYAISFFSNFLQKKPKLAEISKYTFSIAVLVMCARTSFTYNNPVYLWLDQAVRKRVFAKYDANIIKEDLKVGDVAKLSRLDNKDVDCANKIVSMIPDGASVSGPDYLGAHLSMRETYAIFPALYNSADYVIVDVFSQKIFRILDLDVNIISDVVEKLIKDENYELTVGCGNLFVFKRVSSQVKSFELPIQERYEYKTTFRYEIYPPLFVVDYVLPAQVERGKPQKARVVYVRDGNESLNGYVLYMTYVNSKTGELYQAANLPSFSILQPEDWTQDRYYVEDVDVAFPAYMDPGTYKAFISMTNKVKTRNLYLGDIEVK